LPTADKKEAEALQSRTQNPQAFFVSCSPGETRVVEKKFFFFCFALAANCNNRRNPAVSGSYIGYCEQPIKKIGPHAGPGMGVNVCGFK